MQLSKVPNPQFPSIQDISLYIRSADDSIGDSNLCGSSLEGRRSIADFFRLLDHVVVTTTGDYKLQKINDTLSPLTNPPIERSSPGNITAGKYLILGGGRVTFETLVTFSNILVARTESPTVKRIKRDGGGTISSVSSVRSIRDPPDDSQSFKMRLVYRDKGCAVCLAAEIQAIYKYREDSNRYEGAHIIALAYHDLWDTKRFSALVSDPFTDPANADSRFASPSTRTKKDFRRINSLENGILLCLQHHKDYDSFRFAIHPQTHQIFAFHPATAALQDVEVKAPWDSPNVLYPPPHPDFLKLHYVTSIANAMKGSGGDYELDVDDDDDYEGPSELEEI